MFESETNQEVKDRGINAVSIWPNMLSYVSILLWTWTHFWLSVSFLFSVCFVSTCYSSVVAASISGAVKTFHDEDLHMDPAELQYTVDIKS